MGYPIKHVSAVWSSSDTDSDQFEIPVGYVLVAIETPGTVASSAGSFTISGLSLEDDNAGVEAYKVSDVAIATPAVDRIYKVSPNDSAWIHKGIIVGSSAEAENTEVILHCRKM